jgi:hypothetical protein
LKRGNQRGARVAEVHTIGDRVLHHAGILDRQIRLPSEIQHLREIPKHPEASCPVLDTRKIERQLVGKLESVLVAVIGGEIVHQRCRRFGHESRIG